MCSKLNKIPSWLIVQVIYTYYKIRYPLFKKERVLSPQKRILICLLKDINEITYSDVGRIIDSSYSNTRTLYLRGQKQLKDHNTTFYKEYIVLKELINQSWKNYLIISKKKESLMKSNAKELL
jgi:hypothetical protein